MTDFLRTFDRSGHVGTPGLGYGSALNWRDLSPFVQGYLEALFFTDTGPDQAEDGLGPECGFADLHPQSLARIVGDCNQFRTKAAALLDDAYSFTDYRYDEGQAGRDFHYTRNGHGCGFWDRCLGTAGDELSDLARAAGSRDLYRGDDGKLHIS